MDALWSLAAGQELIGRGLLPCLVRFIFLSMAPKVAGFTLRELYNIFFLFSGGLDFPFAS